MTTTLTTAKITACTTIEDGLPVNGEPVKVIGDADGVFVGGNESEDGVISIADVDAGATVNAIGSAENIFTGSEGDFTFEIDGFNT